MMMPLRTPALLLVATLALGACSQGGLFGNDAGGNGEFNGGTNGAFGDASDPSSAAFFNQTIGDRILFEVDQSTLNATAQEVLAQQAQWLQSNPEFTAMIEGHADEQGTREYNLALGARRATAVRDYLVTQGVSANRLQTVSFGKERPLAICSEESCYAQNRRGVTVLAAGAGA